MTVRRGTSSAVGVLALVAALVAAGVAHAAPAGGESAEELFARGKELVLEKRFAEACPLLERSRTLDQGIGTMLWLGDCYEKNGQLASAWNEFKAAASSAARRADDRERVALRRVAALEDRLTRLLVVVPPERAVDGLEIRRDGILLSPEEVAAGIPLDPGVHTISASAPGRKAWSATIDVPSRPDVVAVNVPLLELAGSSSPVPAAPESAPSAPSVPPPAPAPPAAAPETPPPAHAPASWMRISGVSLGVLGIGLAGAGTFFGLKAKSTYDESNANGHCIDDACDPAGKALRSDATSSAAISTIAFGAGAAAITAGVVLYLVAPSSTSSRGAAPLARQATWSVVPTGGPRAAGLAMTHRW